MIFRILMSSRLLPIVIIVLLCSSSLAEPQLQVDPAYTFVGEYCSLMPERSVLTVGETSLRVMSEEHDWQVYLTLMEPLRRVSDGLELPVERFTQFFRDLIPGEIPSFQRYQLTEGEAGTEWHEEEYDWQGLQQGLSDFLLETDPPGRYQTQLRFELTDDTDSTIANPVLVTAEFDLVSAATVELPEPDVAFDVSFAGNQSEGHGESYLVPTVVRANCPWTLSVHSLDAQATGEFGALPPEAIMVRVEISSDGSWQSALPDYLPIEQGRMTAATGYAPPAFTISETIVPLQFSGDVPISVHSGTYDMGFEIIVEAHNTHKTP